ncbi:MAG: 50S ribosomal protein L15 [Vampirovibrionales bacterium]|nr:50S ribosomal protein L15 [Vampirovibrionales bacterium]
MAKVKTKETGAEKTLTLADLRPAKGSTKTKLRVGRGRASGAGKTSNRGHNGEGQRSGNSTKRGFEGGQMPGYRRAPKIRRFVPACRRNWLVLNVGDLEAILLDNESEVTYEMLKELGLLKHTHEGLRLLGGGELKRKLAIQAHHVSASAREKVEASGGTLTLLSVEEASA